MDRDRGGLTLGNIWLRQELVEPTRGYMDRSWLLDAVLSCCNALCLHIKQQLLHVRLCQRRQDPVEERSLPLLRVGVPLIWHIGQEQRQLGCLPPDAVDAELRKEWDP